MSRHAILLQIVAQIIVPIALCLWILAPSTSSLEFVSRLVTSVAAIALARRGPGWWITSMFWRAALMPMLALVSIVTVAVRPATPVWPEMAEEWFAIVIAVGVLAYLGLQLWRTRQPRVQAKFDLNIPFSEGLFVLGGAGQNRILNQHAAVLAVTRTAALRGQAFGVDILGINALGRHSDRLRPKRLDDFNIFDCPVLAPCSGRVMSIENGLEDHPPGARHVDPPAGNHVWITMEDDDTRVLLLAHFRQGSVTVQPGQFVRSGELLGRVGNSGNSSEPHLHIHMQERAPLERPFDGEPLPFTLRGRPCVPNRMFRVGR